MSKSSSRAASKSQPYSHPAKIKSSRSASELIHGASSLQHSLRQDRRLPSHRRQPRPHVRLRTHRLRLRPHRQLPHIHRRRSALPLPPPERIRRPLRHEHHRRRRQDHPQRRPRQRHCAAIHGEIYQGIPRRLRHAQHRAAHAGARHRAHQSNGRLHRRAGEERFRLPHRRWLLLFPHREIPRIRQALKERFRRHDRRRPRRRRRIRKRQRPRLRPLESSQARRSLVGYLHRPRPSRLAHRVLGHVDGAARPQLRPARRRRRPYLSPSRKRNRAVRSAQRQAILPLLVSRALSARRRPEDVEEPRQLLHRPRPDPARPQTVFDPLAADPGPLSQSAQLHLRRIEIRRQLGRKTAQLQISPGTRRKRSCEGYRREGCGCGKHGREGCVGKRHEREGHDFSRAVKPHHRSGFSR